MTDDCQSMVDENGESPAWVQQSDRLAWPILKTLARFEPESFAPLGVPGTSDAVMRLPADWPAEEISALEQALRSLAERRNREQHAEVRRDIDAMTCFLGWELDFLRTESALMVPCPNLAQTIVLGLITLLAAGPGEAGAVAAVARLRRYAGLEGDGLSLAGQAETLIRHRLRRRRPLRPWRQSLVQDLNAGPKLLAELPRLAAQYRLRDHEKAVEALCRQLDTYHHFLRQELLPQCRDDFRLPPDLYAARLRRCGVEMPIDELMHRAEAACVDARRQLVETGHHLARQRGWPDAPFPELLRRLARERLDPGQILSHYTRRLRQLETIVAGADFVSLPRGRPVVRLASEAENAAFPFPHYRWPRMFGGRGDAGDIVLPLTTDDRQADLPGDNYASRAVSWATAVHEGLPGHGLQIGRLLEPDVSLARGPLAFNYAALEGWAVYAETEIAPHLPLEARFLACHNRLRRAVAALLDPGLQSGRFTRRQAARLLRDRIGLSAREAEQAVWRYTVWSPGQATSYFYGHIELAALRTAVEHQLGSSFDGRKYHDELLSQGLLPLSLLRRSLLKARSSDEWRAVA